MDSRRDFLSDLMDLLEKYDAKVSYMQESSWGIEGSLPDGIYVELGGSRDVILPTQFDHKNLQIMLDKDVV